MSQTMKVAEYLFARLKQLGVDAVHGVPGDYNLNLLDYVEPAGLLWVGNANELNAGYAADGYARIKGISALVTTFGVGELSAINAIACAFTERAALVHIVGTPARNAQDARLMIHHTLGDGDYRHFARMASHVTVAQTNLADPRTAVEQIDNTLKQCLIHSRPVYIEVPVDMVGVEVPSESLAVSLSVEENVSDANVDDTLAKVVERLYTAKQPYILVDGETRALGLVNSVQQLVVSTEWPTFTTIFGKSLIDMTLPNVYGIYRGKFAQPQTIDYVKNADLVLCFGPHFSSTNSYNYSSVPDPEKTITFTQAGVTIAKQTFRHPSIKQVLQALIKILDVERLEKFSGHSQLPREELVSFSAVSQGDIIKQDKIWGVLAQVFRPGDIILAETGTAGYGLRETPLPQHTRLFAPVTWLSIGYMLPAAQGAALAQRELIDSGKYHDLKTARTLLFIGDGSIQMTIQELATIVRLNLNVMVFLINNSGYTIERCIHGKNQAYNDVSDLRYLEAPSFFGAPKTSYIATARTYGDLEHVLKDPSFVDGSGLRMVEIHMDRMDAPVGPLLDMLNQQE